MSEAVATKKKINWAEEAWQLFLLALAVLAVHTAVAKPFYIPSGSMLPGLLVGDRLIVSKYPYGYSYLSPSLNVLPKMDGRLFGSLPERGDIVVLKSPIAQDDWIKRVIGLPGDTVQMKDGRLWLNGVAVPKLKLADTVMKVTPNSDCATMIDAQYRVITPDGTAECHLPTYRETLPGGRTYTVLDLANLPQDNTEPVIVPEGHVFLMGDNRDNSEDSRFPAEVGGLGLLPVENIVGRAEFTTFSLDGSTSLNPVTWVTALRDRWFLSLRDN